MSSEKRSPCGSSPASRLARLPRRWASRKGPSAASSSGRSPRCDDSSRSSRTAPSSWSCAPRSTQAHDRMDEHMLGIELRDYEVERRLELYARARLTPDPQVKARARARVMREARLRFDA